LKCQKKTKTIEVKWDWTI